MSATDHGSASTYRNHACRCPDCKAAHAAYVFIQRANRKARLAEADVEHGTSSTYLNWLCRCGPCREAHAAANREYSATRAT